MPTGTDGFSWHSNAQPVTIRGKTSTLENDQLFEEYICSNYNSRCCFGTTPGLKLGWSVWCRPHENQFLTAGHPVPFCSWLEGCRWRGCSCSWWQLWVLNANRIPCGYPRFGHTQCSSKHPTIQPNQRLPDIENWGVLPVPCMCFLNSQHYSQWLLKRFVTRATPQSTFAPKGCAHVLSIGNWSIS